MADSGLRTAVESVESEAGTSHDFACECGFTSLGWPSEMLAKARGVQHLEEHVTGKPAPPLTDLLSNPADRDAATKIALALKAAREGRAG